MQVPTTEQSQLDICGPASLVWPLVRRRSSGVSTVSTAYLRCTLTGVTPDETPVFWNFNSLICPSAMHLHWCDPLWHAVLLESQHSQLSICDAPSLVWPLVRRRSFGVSTVSTVHLRCTLTGVTPGETPFFWSLNSLNCPSAMHPHWCDQWWDAVLLASQQSHTLTDVTPCETLVFWSLNSLNCSSAMHLHWCDPWWDGVLLES